MSADLEQVEIDSAEAARFWYRAAFIGNHDGDTVDVLLDLGFRFTWQMRLRLFGINAPEIKGATIAAGKASRDWLHALLLGRTFFVLTHRDEADKYGGRWLAEIYAPVTSIDDPATTKIDPAGSLLTNVNQLLVRYNLAVPYLP